MTAPDQRTNAGPATNLTEKARVLLGSALLAFAWLLSATVVIVVLTMRPDLVPNDVAAVMILGIVTAGGATFAVCRWLI